MVRLLLRYIFSKFQKSPHHLCVEFADGSKWQNYQSGEPEILIRFKTTHAEVRVSLLNVVATNQELESI